MATSTVASTTLDFLETISPNDSIWDAGGVEALVEQINGLATQKRHERIHGITQAMDALRAQISMLPNGELCIDLSLIDDVETGSLDAEFLVPGIEALTEAIASYRQETRRTTDGIARTIAERSAVYQCISANLQLIGDRHAQLLALLTPVRGHPSPVTVARAPNMRQVSSSAAVPIEMWAVGYFRARYGRRTGGKPAETPDELGGVGWKDAYFLFYGSLNDGRSAGRFKLRLKSCRDTYDRHVDSGRRGWQGKLPELAVTVMAYWQNRPREELWEYVKQFVTR